VDDRRRHRARGRHPTSRRLNTASITSAERAICALMEWGFEVRADGIIEMHVDPAHGAMDEALNDAVTSRAPRGAVRQGLSTYWIDRTEERLLRARHQGLAAPFASGDAWYLRLEGDTVVAASDYDEPREGHSETMPLEKFLDLLAAWRDRVIGAGGVSGSEAARIAG
jgi:hypothetical protein